MSPIRSEQEGGGGRGVGERERDGKLGEEKEEKRREKRGKVGRGAKGDFEQEAGHTDAHCLLWFPELTC